MRGINGADIQDAYHYALVSAFPNGHKNFPESAFAGRMEYTREEYYVLAIERWNSMGLRVPQSCDSARKLVKVIETTAHCLGYNAYTGNKY